MEFERGGQMRGEIGPVVTARVYVERVRDMARLNHAVERRRARVEAIVVLISAIEVDGDVSEVRSSRQGQRADAFPESAIGWRTEHGAEDAQPAALRRIGDGNGRGLFDHGCAMRA